MRRLYALVIRDPGLLRRVLRDASRGRLRILGVVVFVEMDTDTARGWGQKTEVYRVEEAILSLTLKIVELNTVCRR